MDRLMLGYDYKFYSDVGVKIPIYAPIGHLIVVGGSGSVSYTHLDVYKRQEPRWHSRSRNRI